jgi:hypothetical protein
MTKSSACTAAINERPTIGSKSFIRQNNETSPFPADAACAFSHRTRAHTRRSRWHEAQGRPACENLICEMLARAFTSEPHAPLVAVPGIAAPDDTIFALPEKGPSRA